MSDENSMIWIIASVVLVAVGVGTMVYIAFPLPAGKLCGGFIFMMGVLNLVSYKQTSRTIFLRAQLSWPVVSKFWLRSGEKGVRVLFLGIAVILTLAGCVLLIAGHKEAT